MSASDWILIAIAVALCAFAWGLLLFDDPTRSEAEDVELCRCRHDKAVPVESSVTGETVALWCPTCTTQLPAPTHPGGTP